MKIETKLALNNMRKNKKRTLYTTISLILCTTLILTTILLISSVRNGVSENFATEYNDYHIILKDLSVERFNRIKNKEYLDKIYVQKNEDAPLEKVNSSYVPIENTTVYLKYKNIKNVFSCTNDIIRELNLSEIETRNAERMITFNKEILTVHGYIGVHITNDANNVPQCVMKVNYAPIISLMIITLIVSFSMLFIIILYNAFLITINERKKEYAILNSVGGTEGQVLKMIFKEALIMGIIGILVGGLLSVLLSNIVLSNINNILNRAGYYFRLVFDIKYILLALTIIVINIYFSVLIPSVKASSTSVIQGIRNNKEIKNKKRKTILEKILPIEGRVGIKNIRRNKSKYRLIMILLIINITIFISISTYIRYEKETADIITGYDVDAEIFALPREICEEKGVDVREKYKEIIKDYETQYNRKVECLEYKCVHYSHILIETAEALENKDLGHNYEDGNASIIMDIIGLSDEIYNKYITKLKGNYGDFIFYNGANLVDFEIGANEPTYIFTPIFKKNAKFKLKLINVNYINNNFGYEIIEPEILDNNIILSDEIVEGFKEVKTSEYASPTLFMNMETYNRISNYLETKYGKMHNREGDNNTRTFWDDREDFRVKIKCEDIVEFKNYINIENNIDILENYGIGHVEFYTIENAEKLMYIDIIELVLKVMMIAIITIGIVSTVNIMNASLIERKEDFNIMYRMGATKGNIKKILIYECIYMFMKALIISIILSIPIIHIIVKRMEKVLVLNKLLIPFSSIGIFIAVMFAISLIITLFSTKMIKEE